MYTVYVVYGSIDIRVKDWKRDHVRPLQLYYCVETIRVVIFIGGVGGKTLTF